DEDAVVAGVDLERRPGRAGVEALEPVHLRVRGGLHVDEGPRNGLRVVHRVVLSVDEYLPGLEPRLVQRDRREVERVRVGVRRGDVAVRERASLVERFDYKSGRFCQPWPGDGPEWLVALLERALETRLSRRQNVEGVVVAVEDGVEGH